MDSELSPIEQVWNRFDNKYLAVYLAALEARRINDLQKKHLYDQSLNPILEGIRRVVTGEATWKRTK